MTRKERSRLLQCRRVMWDGGFTGAWNEVLHDLPDSELRALYDAAHKHCEQWNFLSLLVGCLGRKLGINARGR